jgi:hypothetical protein
MKHRKPTRKKQKCMYCSRQVEVSRKGHLMTHLNGARQCVGTGFIADRMKAQLVLIEEAFRDR